MVFMHFPSELTEEELMLKNKFLRLKKKKKALENLNPKPQPDTSSNTPKFSRESARDARETAKKLLKSGAIGPIIKVPNHTNKESFKRPCSMEYKKQSISKVLTSYQPFSAPSLVIGDVSDSMPKATTATSSKYKNICTSITPASSKTTRYVQSSSKPREPVPETRRKGFTIFVGAESALSTDLLRTIFKRFGTIINISLEVKKNQAFITFDSQDNANKAVDRMNARTVCGIKLRVFISGNQPKGHGEKGFSDRNVIATTNSKKRHLPEDRSLVTYSDVL